MGVLAITAVTVGPAGAESGKRPTASEQLGGYEGILAFLDTRAVPAVLADPQLNPFFRHLTESPLDIEECLAHLLDHDLGGPSKKNGEITTGGHVCRSSMSKVHRGLNISADDFNLFVAIVGREAAAAGVPSPVIAEVAKTLNSYFGSIVQA